MTSSTTPFPAWKRAVWTAAITVLLTATLNLMAAQRLRSYRELTESSEQIMEQLTRLRGHLLNAETGQRGYLLVGEEKYLVPYKDAVGLVTGDLDTLFSYAKLGRIDADATARLALLSRDKLKELDQTIALRAAGRAESTMAVVRSDTGRLLMDSARALVRRLTDEQHILLEDRRLIEERWSNIVLIVVLLGTALTLGVLMYLFRALTVYSAEQRAATRELEQQMRELEQLARSQRARDDGSATA